MSGDGKKDWERPWSTEEIVDNADNWNLACDAALLNTLKAFGDKIVNKSEEVHKKLDNLCDDLEKTSIRFDLARNEFNSLRNSQFMEFRVYEDDETLPTEDKQEEKAEDNVPKKETMEDLRKAVALGLDILDEFYEKVEVTVSDSEDDEVMPSYVYRRKDPYIDRRLPYVIGSDEWYKKWHVGLLESSDSENEKSPSEKFSDSENEEPYQVKDHSDVSSEFSNTSGLNITKGQPVEVLAANKRTSNDFLASNSESDSPGPSTPRVPNFAEQLAAKLGNVIRENKSLLEEPEVNRRPIQKKQSDYGALISDEPPPLDENLIGNENVHGIFSGGKGLFDDEDEDDDTFWNSGKPNISTRNQQGSNIVRENNLSKGLFEEDSDEDIFSSARRIDASHQIKQAYLPSKTAAPIFSEEPPLLENEEQREKKKPTGGVSPFGNASIFQSQKIGDILKQRKGNPSENTTAKIVKNEPILFDDPNEEIVQNTDSIDRTISTVPKEVQFNEPRIEERNIFNNSNYKQTNRISLPEEDDIFENSDKKYVNRESREIENKTKNLFDDDIFGEDLFSDMDKEYTNLFSDKSAEIVRRNNEPTKDNSFQNVSDIENEYDYSWRKTSKSKISSLFDDEDEDYDLFKPNKVAEKTKVPEKVHSKEKKIVIEKKEAVEKKEVVEKKEDKINESSKSKLSLFNDEFEDVDDLFTEILKDRKSNSAQKQTDYNVSKETIDNSGRSEYIEENRASNNVQFEEDILEKQVKGSIIPNEDTEIPKVETQPRSSISVPHVNFLDSVPPPEDIWDNSPENAFDDLEPYGNDDFQSQPSSLFDSEPPSLFFNDASGTDQGYNRIDPVHSSDPSRSSLNVSSERSIFPSENQDFTNTLSQSTLPSVPEFSDSSQADMGDSASKEIPTASGILEITTDLEISNENTNDQNDVGEPKKTGNPVKSVAFLEDIFNEDETDDLFATLGTDVSIRPISGSIIADKDKDEGSLLDKNLDRDEKKTSEESAKLDKGDEMQSNISKITEKFQQMARSTEDPPKNIAIPGKLTHKLQINVGALLPGGAPPRRNREQDSDDSQNENFLSKSLPASKFRPDLGEQRVNYLGKTAPMFRTVSESDASKNLPKIEKSVSFDDTTDIEVLRNVTKDRPKIQVKRRPSSRRARQESLRKSVPDFRLLDDATESEGIEHITKEYPKVTEIPSEIEDTPKPSVIENLPPKVPEFSSSFTPKMNIFEDEDDESDDLFKSIQKDVKSVNQAKIVSTRKQDLFADDDDFFETIKKTEEKNSRHAPDEQKVISEQKPLSIKKNYNVAKKEKNFLFDSSDDSDDFLKTTTKKETNQPTISIIGKLSQNKSKDLFDSSDEDGDFLESLGRAKGFREEKPKPSKTRGSALFTDENDDEDIFGSSGPRNKTKPDIQPSVIDKKAPKPSSLRKLGSIDGEEDPLSALLR